MIGLAMSSLWFFIWILCSLGSEGSVSLNYTEVRKFGNSCPQLDSCEHQHSHDRKERNCMCDYLCTEYGDCCIDARGNKLRNIASDYSCIDLKQFGGVYMKDSCPPSYSGSEEVRHLCETTDIGNLSDPLGSLPVTDSVTGTTYKNYYCSICNDKAENTVLWTPRLECPTVTMFDNPENITTEYVFKNLASVGDSWGLYLDGDNGSLFFHDCEVDPVMPVLLENKIRLCKPDLVSDCPVSWRDEDSRKMCRSYLGPKFIHGDSYRNAHCALCNGMNTTRLSCQSAEMRGVVFYRQFENHAFSLLLDINGGKGNEVGLVQVCDDGEVFDPFFKLCRSLKCMSGYVRKGKECVRKSDVDDMMSHSGDGPVVSAEPEVVEMETNEKSRNSFVPYRPVTDSTDAFHSQNGSGMSYNLSAMNTDDIKEDIGKFQNCLLISLDDEDFVMLPNQSIYVPKYDKVYEPTSYHTADGSILVCAHFTSENDVKFMPIMGYITVGGLTISMICFLLHFVAFWIVPDLQNLSGKSLVSQCISLFAAYVFFITGLMDNLSYKSCTTLSFLTYYFFQVSFFWMAVMAFDVWRTLKIATTELRVSTGKQNTRFTLYSFLAWATPLFIVILVACAEFTDVFPASYKPDFANPRCWFKQRKSLLVFFAVPLIAILVTNVILFLWSSRMILMTTQSSAKQQNKANRRNFKLYLRLALLMGLTWLIGIIAGYVDSEVLWYFFIIFNTLQGLFIFVAFTCSTKVVSFFKTKWRNSGKPREFRSTTQSASTGSCQTSTTNLHPSLAKKISAKFLLKKKSSSSNNFSNLHSPTSDRC